MAFELEPILIGSFAPSEGARISSALRVVKSSDDLIADQKAYIEAFARILSVVKLYVEDPNSADFFSRKEVRLVIAYSIGDACNGVATEVEERLEHHNPMYAVPLCQCR